MKNILAGLLCLLISTSAFAASQAKNANQLYPDTSSSSKDYNFRFDPLYVLLGGIGAHLDISVAPEWTLGPEFSFMHYHADSDPGYTSNYDVSGYTLGFHGTWFKNGNFTDGLYVTPSIGYVHAEVKTTDIGGDVKGNASSGYAGVLVGYGWFWDSFNMMLGGGAVVGLGDYKVTVTDSSGTETDVSTRITGLTIEYTLGWTF